MLRGRQRVFIDKHADALAGLAHSYTSYFARFTDVYQEAFFHHADEHAKKLLRIDAWGEINENGVYMTPSWLDRDGRVVYKMKSDEIAKPGKAPRGIGDLTVMGSLAGFVVTAALKKAQAMEPLEYRSGLAEFIKSPKRASLQHVFDTMQYHSYAAYMAYFSDDSVLSYNFKGKRCYANLDISKCDISHSPAIFQKLREMVPPGGPRDAVDILIEQCKAPCKITSLQSRKEGSGKKNCVLTPEGPVLYSGSTLTTCINNQACQLIFMAIMDADTSECETVEELGKTLENAILDTGYVVTGLSGRDNWCERFEDVQFLKHSPTLSTTVMDSDPKYRPLKNLGVLGRASGVIRGDFPGRGDLRSRSAAFQLTLLHGMHPKDSLPMINVMKETARREINVVTAKQQCQLDRLLAHQLKYKVVAGEEEEMVTFTMEDMARRYRLSDTEIGELMNYARYGYGYFTSCSAWDKILALDYGLRSLEYRLQSERS
jgi:hypothetical protein